MFRIHALWLVICILCASVALAQPYSVKQEGTQLCLYDGPHRLLLYDESRALTLPGGVVLTPQPTQPSIPNSTIYMVSRQGKPEGVLDLSVVLKEWLTDDARWGGSQKANSLRYYASQSGGGVIAVLRDAITMDTSLYAILSIMLAGPSGIPLAEQFLVRITANPNIELVLLRRLSIMPNGPLGRRWPCSLYRMGKQMLLYQHDETTGDTPADCQAELFILDSTGAMVRRLATLPGNLIPVGLLNERWLVLGPALNMEAYPAIPEPVQEYDLRKGTLKPIKGPWDRLCSVIVPDTGGRIVIMQEDPQREGDQPDGQRSTYRNYLVQLPKNTRVQLQTDNSISLVYYWRDMLIDYTGAAVSLYNATTGKLIQRIELDQQFSPIFPY